MKTNPKPQTLNSKQIQNIKTQNSNSLPVLRNCHAELVSASQYLIGGSRNEFGMTI
jgi:hypothetical protein